jgi:hypothetical protein
MISQGTRNYCCKNKRWVFWSSWLSSTVIPKCVDQVLSSDNVTNKSSLQITVRISNLLSKLSYKIYKFSSYGNWGKLEKL